MSSFAYVQKLRGASVRSCHAGQPCEFPRDSVRRRKRCQHSPPSATQRRRKLLCHSLHARSAAPSTEVSAPLPASFSCKASLSWATKHSRGSSKHSQELSMKIIACHVLGFVGVLRYFPRKASNSCFSSYSSTSTLLPVHLRHVYSLPLPFGGKSETGYHSLHFSHSQRTVPSSASFSCLRFFRRVRMYRRMYSRLPMSDGDDELPWVPVATHGKLDLFGHSQASGAALGMTKFLLVILLAGTYVP